MLVGVPKAQVHPTYSAYTSKVERVNQLGAMNGLAGPLIPNGPWNNEARGCKRIFKVVSYC
jgi:hypothetical protein